MGDMDHRLNDKVLRGLERLATLVEESDPDEIGYPAIESNVSARKGYEEVQRAVTWIRAVRANRDRRKSGS